MVLQVLDFFKHACSDVATKLSRNDWGRSKGKFWWFKSGFTGHWGNCTEAAEALETFGGKVMNRLVCMQSTKFVRSKRCHDNMVSLAINLNWRMSNGTWPMPNLILYMGSSIGFHRGTVPADWWKTSIQVQEPKVKHIHAASRQGPHRDQRFARLCSSHGHVAMGVPKRIVFFTTLLHLYKQNSLVFTMLFLVSNLKSERTAIYTVFGPPYKNIKIADICSVWSSKRARHIINSRAAKTTGFPGIYCNNRNSQHTFFRFVHVKRTILISIAT